MHRPDHPYRIEIIRLTEVKTSNLRGAPDTLCVGLDADPKETLGAWQRSASGRVHSHQP
jgi:hypothetical protein